MNVINEQTGGGLPPQLDFLIAAKLIHFVSNVVFEALDVLLVGAAVDEVEEDA